MVAAALALAARGAAAAPSPNKELAALIDTQVGGLQPMGEDEGVPAGVYLDDVQLSTVGSNDVGKITPGGLPDAVIGPCFPKEHTITLFHVTPSADGKSAAVSFTVEINSKCDVSGELFYLKARASEVAVKTADGWRIAGGEWSFDQDNKRINDKAKAGTLSALDPVADTDEGDAGVRAAFAALLATGVDATAAARKDLIAIGSGPGERSTTGAAFARPWKAAWVGHVEPIGKLRVELAPSGTTGWVTADVSLTKTKGGATYKIPFRMFAVFDKTAGGWSLIHVHFAVPSP